MGIYALPRSPPHCGYNIFLNVSRASLFPLNLATSYRWPNRLKKDVANFADAKVDGIQVNKRDFIDILLKILKVEPS